MASTSTSQPVKFRWPGRLPDGRLALAFGLHMTRFLSSTLLLSWGVFAAVFLFLGGVSLDGMMHQLNNIASRYVEADPERVQSFRDLFLAAHLTVSVLLIILRRDRIVPAQLPEGIRDHG